ncbi:hypothetical protein [Agromyces sp. Leaf222]|uniref:hypothetical protein n=1 Tax=Agromyces sp. Leaf222 TaxID=1735688 RepID=UPI0006F5ABB6|nr:hypothetical protein [Agromyces sp. Leaf222]KQM81453.1 hypothetical protein ASE68_17005 [Agromyces sp. Leaf222]
MSNHENAEPTPVTTPDTQDSPVQDGSLTDADGDDRLEGIIEQVRGDTLLGHVDDLRQMVRDRLEQAGLGATPNDVDAVISAVQSTP